MQLWRVWRTLLESAAAAGPDVVGQIFGEGVQGWRKAVRWAAGLPVEWYDGYDRGMLAACVLAATEGRLKNIPRIDADMAISGSRATFYGQAVDGFSWQQGRGGPPLEGVASPALYEEFVRSSSRLGVRESLAREQDHEVVEATLSLLRPTDALEIAPLWAIGQVTASIAARIEDDPFADSINAALYEASFRWDDETSDDGSNGVDASILLDPDGLQSIADLMLLGLAAQSRGQGTGALSFSGADRMLQQVPSMLGDRDDATAKDAANAVLGHSDHEAVAGRACLHLLATPAGQHALDSLTADEQDDLYDNIVKGLRRGHDEDVPAWWESLPGRVQADVGGRMAVADVFAGDETKRCVRAAAAAAAAGLNGDPADPDTHPEWADLPGDTPGGHKIALLATNAAERGDADERTVKEIFGLAPFVQPPSDRPV